MRGLSWSPSCAPSACLGAECFAECLAKLEEISVSDIKADYREMAREMLRFSRTVGDRAARRAELESVYPGTSFRGSWVVYEEYLRGEKFIPRWSLRLKHFTGGIKSY